MTRAHINHYGAGVFPVIERSPRVRNDGIVRIRHPRSNVDTTPNDRTDHRVRLSHYVDERENSFVATNCVAGGPEGLVLCLRALTGDVLHYQIPGEHRHDRVARQEELADFGTVVEVPTGRCVVQFEQRPPPSCLLQLVVVPKSQALPIGVSTTCVSPEIKRRIYQHRPGPLLPYSSSARRLLAGVLAHTQDYRTSWPAKVE